TLAAAFAEVNTPGYGAVMLKTATARRESSPLSRDDWVAGALRQLARDGIDKVLVAPLARQLGVTKGSFYWHFKDRAALLDAMLTEWERTDAEIVSDLHGKSGDAETRLRMVIELSVRQIGGRLETALRDWGRRDVKVRGAIQRIDRRRLSELRSLFGSICASAEEAEARSWLLYSLLTGVHLITSQPVEIDRKKLLLRCLAVLTRPE
ncbi:MAG: TetR/AcrR family transcriptional regulator, partial [Rhodospirillales bacterium]|nr:TetR/AcrR family transcriptional regulator [Rhodospirillales bacterium]